jgi:hypothetical protein
MASPLQQQSMRRKLIYTALILVLFAITTFGARGLEIRGSTPPPWTVTAQANGLGLRQHNQGEVELTGSAIRLGLTGSRGFAICVLWSAAMDKQKKHEWNELELIVRSLTKLQPHFITPWLFQSWNLAYNVSVESDLPKDKYFYISRGIELLAEGERQNKGHPDLRYSIGFYNQHKIGLSDEHNTHRCLYRLSCIPLHLRDPNRLRPLSATGGRPAVDMERFAEFCRKNPMLVRRLRENLQFETPDQIVDFLELNRNIPSRYVEAPPISSEAEPPTQLKPAGEQFPLLPPRFDQSDEPELTDADELSDADDNYTVARSWYAYSLKAMPPPSSIPTMNDPPYDRTKYRMPRYMASQIFRGYPSRGQTFIADTYEAEGWFDRDGWLIRGWFKDDRFPGLGQDSRVGDGVAWARDAWDRAYRMWQRHGKDTGLFLTPEELKDLMDRGEKYRKYLEAQGGFLPQEPPPDKRDELMDSYKAYDHFHWYRSYRHMTNFPHFLARADAERRDETIGARKAFFYAERLRKEGQFEQALTSYREALEKFCKIMLENADFGSDSDTQDSAYEAVVIYQRLLEERRAKRYQLRPLLVFQDLLAQAATLHAPGPVLLIPSPYLDKSERLPIPFVHPMQVRDAYGEPLIRPDTIQRVRVRHNMPDYSAPPVPRTPPGAPRGGPQAVQPVTIESAPKK